jgi:hypothetical protein
MKIYSVKNLIVTQSFCLLLLPVRMLVGEILTTVVTVDVCVEGYGICTVGTSSGVAVVRNHRMRSEEQHESFGTVVRSEAVPL